MPLRFRFVQVNQSDQLVDDNWPTTAWETAFEVTDVTVTEDDTMDGMLDVSF